MDHDYGIDLEVFTFNPRGEPEEGVILLQLKASNHLRLDSRKHAVSFRIARVDLVLWLAQPMPVILVLYDARRDKAYWLYVQSYFRKRRDFNLFSAGKTITVHVDQSNVLDKAAIRRFVRFRNRMVDQMNKVIHDEDDTIR